MDNHMIITQDPLANYVCGKVKDEDMNELVSGDMCDYGMVNKKIIDKPEELEKVDSRKNLSYYQVNSVEEGIEWYRKLDSRIPEELLPLFSRYNFGDLSTMTKKQIRNENKKKKKKKIDPKITIDYAEKDKPFVVRF